MKKKITLIMLSFMSSYIKTSFFFRRRNLKIVIQDVKQLIPMITYL